MHLISETNRKWWLLGAVSCVLGLVLLDETVVGIALPTIQKELGLSVNTAHWVVNSYLLSFACFVAVGGKLADLFGVLRVFLIGLVLFGLCSVACGFAENGAVLITARALQGLGAAIIFPLFMAMITMTFKKEARGQALAIGGAIGTTFLALGPLVGALLTELISWRWIFWINPVLALGIGLIVSLTWRDVARPKGQRIDWWGLVLIASGMVCLVFALMEADRRGWDDPLILGALATGALLLVLFVKVETRLDAPLIEVELFNSPIFTGSYLTIFMAQFAKMPLFVFVALYAQSELKLSVIASGALVMLSPLLQPMTAAVCSRIADKVPRRKLILFGLGSLTICLLWICLVAPLNNVYVFAPGLLFAGIAFPFLFVPSRAAIMANLPEHKHGQGGGIAMTSQMIGGTVGLAVSSAAFAVGGYQLVFAMTALLLILTILFAAVAFREV